MFRFLSFRLPNYVVQGLADAILCKQASFSNGIRNTHSLQASVKLKPMKIKILPALSDNYMYLITDLDTNQAAVVDPVDHDTVFEAVQEERVVLTKILTTHHHWDHAGGNEQLVKKYPHPLQVFGGDKRIGALTNEVKDGDKFNIGDLTVECLFTPCHTTGHICYFVSAVDQTPVVFTGDTLFISGCGKFFEGTADQMYFALIEKLGKLPNHTKVFCGHEYTLQNLMYARFVDKQNPEILKKITWANERRKKRLPTVPSTIGEEKALNPFMRVVMGEIQNHAGCSSPITTMQYIRREKDKFSMPKAYAADNLN